MADREFEEFRQFFEQLPQHIKAPSNCYTLAHDISLESPSVEEAPDPPDPPSEEDEAARRSSAGGDASLSSPRPQPPGRPAAPAPSKCCSDDDPCCPQLLVEQTQELRAANAACNSPKRQGLGPCLSAGIQPTSCPSPICGSPAPRRPRPVSSGPSSVESMESTDTADVSTGEFFGGDLEDPGDGGNTSPEGDMEGAARPNAPWDSKPSERKRRKLPEIPKDKKSFSTASILALRTPNLAEELQEAESGVASRSSTPDALTLINNHSKPILLLKCHSYIRDDSSSPDSELRLPINDIDSGNSTQHSPDGAKSMSPQATVNGSLSPMSPGSGGMPFPQLELLEATHRGLYRFIPRHHDEVDIEIGDPIYVQKEADDLWCEGVNLRTGRQGIFPAAHVTDVDYSDFDPTVPKVKKERYLLNYLGSIETLCHKGNQVLCQAVRKIAGGEESAQHPHPCILEVSDQGIRMVDKSKPAPNHVPCHDYFYHLKHVSFCAFHPKDHRYFGFITKHPTIQRFACHVFRSNDSTRPVAEAVGRAFQRFYQKFIETAYPIEDIYLE
ncbi:JNK-interacting protein 1-like isoform X2 [Panulirus ornatus]|uniref:JNK-interacting protein 1-like isoform X2 n=1 Tax=Panulirus ornatus TaxID=150431 RepID=UPI003A89E45A